MFKNKRIIGGYSSSVCSVAAGMFLNILLCQVGGGAVTVRYK